MELDSRSKFINAYSKIDREEGIAHRIVKYSGNCFKWALISLILGLVAGEVLFGDKTAFVNYTLLGIVILSFGGLWFGNIYGTTDEQFHLSLGIRIETIGSKYSKIGEGALIIVESERIQIFQQFMFDMDEKVYDELTNDYINKLLGICPVEVKDGRIHISEENASIFTKVGHKYIPRIKRVSEIFGMNLTELNNDIVNKDEKKDILLIKQEIQELVGDELDHAIKKEEKNVSRPVVQKMDSAALKQEIQELVGDELDHAIKKEEKNVSRPVVQKMDSVASKQEIQKEEPITKSSIKTTNSKLDLAYKHLAWEFFHRRATFEDNIPLFEKIYSKININRVHEFLLSAEIEESNHIPSHEWENSRVWYYFQKIKEEANASENLKL